jgi:hypothetical protein
LASSGPAFRSKEAEAALSINRMCLRRYIILKNFATFCLYRATQARDGDMPLTLLLKAGATDLWGRNSGLPDVSCRALCRGRMDGFSDKLGF